MLQVVEEYIETLNIVKARTNNELTKYIYGTIKYVSLKAKPIAKRYIVISFKKASL